MYHIIKDTDTSNGLIQLNQVHIDNYTLHSFTFTNNVYNVSSRNNVIPYYEGSTLSLLTLTEQFCDGTDMATDIASKINAVTAGTATCTFDTNKYTFTITNTVSFSLKFGDAYDNMSNNLLGFTATNTSSSTSQTSNTTADLTPFKYIKINIADSGVKNVIDQSFTSNTFLIQGSSNFGEKFIYNGKDYDVTPQTISLKPTKTMKIVFTDEKNKTLTLTDWHLILKSPSLI